MLNPFMLDMLSVTSDLVALTRSLTLTLTHTRTRTRAPARALCTAHAAAAPPCLRARCFRSSPPRRTSRSCCSAAASPIGCSTA